MRQVNKYVSESVTPYRNAYINTQYSQIFMFLFIKGQQAIVNRNVWCFR